MWWCLSDCDWWHDLTELCSPSTHRGRISESQLTLHTNCQSVNHWKLVSCCHDVLCSRVFSHCDGTERSADHITIILSSPPPLRDRDRDVTGNDTRNNRGETQRKYSLSPGIFLIKHILTKIQKNLHWRPLCFFSIVFRYTYVVVDGVNASAAQCCWSESSSVQKPVWFE